MNLIGTIINVKNFLGYEGTSIKIDNGAGGNELVLVELAQNRKYIIPDFQREIRWKQENLVELVDDITKNSKFLGNIILSKTGSKDYEIIDGQQRITMLLMILNYISKFKDEFSIFKPCSLNVSSFEGFELIYEHQFDISKLSEPEKSFLNETDFFDQLTNYLELWETLKSLETLNEVSAAEAFLANLQRSTVNVIINKAVDGDYSMDYFLDVNLKGVRLDAEDIFKAILFSRDDSKEIRLAWNKLKKYSKRAAELRINYPLMTVIEHVMYIVLNDTEFKTIRFNNDFRITKEFLRNGTKKYHKGEHILNVILSKKISMEIIEQSTYIYEVFNETISNYAPNISFNSIFKCSDLDNSEYSILFYFVKYAILERNSVPKIFLVKYLSDLQMNDENSKKHVRRIYTIAVYCNLFSMFMYRKDIKPLLTMLNSDDWFYNMFIECKEFLKTQNISQRLVNMHYEMLSLESEDEFSFRCKLLALIYNYFNSNSDQFAIIKGRTQDLKKFIVNNDEFSKEHFILSECGKIKLNDDKEFIIPVEYKKIIQNTFNFIFIPSELNKQIGNFTVELKANKLESCINELKCDYSRKVIEITKQSFVEFIKVLSNENVTQNDLDRYFKSYFIEEYIEYSTKIVKEISSKISSI